MIHQYVVSHMLCVGADVTASSPGPLRLLGPGLQVTHVAVTALRPRLPEADMRARSDPPAGCKQAFLVAAWFSSSVTLAVLRNITSSVTGHRQHQSSVGRENNEPERSSWGHSCVCVTPAAPADL